MFAEFETGLRLYWARARGTSPPTEHLLNAIAARRVVPDDQRDNAHLVRKYRNSLLHERADDDAEPLSIAEARGSLCTYFSFLPLEW